MDARFACLYSYVHYHFTVAYRTFELRSLATDNFSLILTHVE